MAVTASGLKDEIVGNINVLSDTDKADTNSVHDAIATGIVDYLTANLQANGTYAGVLTGAPPPTDPLSGPYVWSVNTMTLTGAQLVVGAAGSFTGWVTAIQTGIATVTFVGGDDTGVITTSVPALLPAYNLSSLTQAVLGESDSFDSCWTAICGEIITNLLATVPAPTPVAAVSTSPGTGTVAWTALQ